MTYMVTGKQYIAMSGYGTIIGYALADEGRILTAIPPSQPVVTMAEALSALPEDPAKAVTVRACTGCHVPSVWSGSRRSRDGWDETLKRMTVRGLALSTADHEAVLGYLSTYFGPVNLNGDRVPGFCRLGFGLGEFGRRHPLACPRAGLLERVRDSARFLPIGRTGSPAREFAGERARRTALSAM